MLINVTVKYCNCTVQKLPYKVLTHFHKYWELVFYGGKGISTVKNIPYRYVPGSYVIIPAGMPHSEESLEEGLIICIGFESDLPTDTFHCPCFQDTEGGIEAICKNIVEEIEKEPPYYTYRINLLLQDLLVQTMRKTDNLRKENNEKLDMLLSYLDAYFTTNIDFEVLAKSMNYSYDYLRHFFKANKQMSLKQYVIQRRISMVKEYLKTTMSITEIASVCGFASSAHLTTTFRQVTGTTPSQFRESCRKIITDGNDTILYDSQTSENGII